MKFTTVCKDPRYQGQLPNPGDLFRVPGKQTVYLAVAPGSPITNDAPHTTIGVTIDNGMLFRLRNETGARVGFEILRQLEPLKLTGA